MDGGHGGSRTGGRTNRVTLTSRPNARRRMLAGMRYPSLVFVLVLLGCESPPAPSNTTPDPVASTRAPTAASAQPRRGLRAKPIAPPQAGGLYYLERATGGANLGERLPLIVALHGLGDSAGPFLRLFQGFETKARIVALRAPDKYGGGFSWFDFHGSRKDKKKRADNIAAAADAVAKAIIELSEKKPVAGKPIVTGFSQGGMLSFALAVKHPEKISAAVPIGGALPRPLVPLEKPTETVPILALHGGADTRVPIAPTREAVAALQKLGVPATLREFPGVGHTIPAEVRRELFTLLTEASQKAAASK